jgi:hypothetical protein
MLLLDNTIFKGIVRITQDILRFKFFYDAESLNKFFEDFTQYIANEYCAFEEYSDIEFKNLLRFDAARRRYFTSYFVCFHLHDLLVNNLHFSEMELDHFENLLPKCVGGYHVKQQGSQRTNH